MPELDSLPYEAWLQRPSTLRYLLEQQRVDVDYLKITSLADLEPEITSALVYRLVLVHVGFGIGDRVATYVDLGWAWVQRSA